MQPVCIYPFRPSFLASNSHSRPTSTQHTNPKVSLLVSTLHIICQSEGSYPRFRPAPGGSRTPVYFCSPSRSLNSIQNIIGFRKDLLPVMDSSDGSDLSVAPLHINKDCLRTSSNTSSSSQSTLTSIDKQRKSQNNGQITPPLTPQSSVENLQARNESSRTAFQTYLRAFYAFHPTCDDTSSTITLPLNYGDIILVHSVHTSGWADGTLLSSGARGWLPTNYCEAYNNEPARVLLKALTKFWDLAKGSSIRGLEALANQDYVRGLVAGVRCLLVSLPMAYH